MGIVVTKGDTINLFVWGISAVQVRAIVNLRPESWWTRIFRGLSKAMLGGTDPHNLIVDVVSNTDRSQALGTTMINEDGEIDSAMVMRAGGSANPVGPGEIFVTVAIGRQGVLGTQYVNLIGGYLKGGKVPSYPGTLDAEFDGPGRLLQVSLSAPAAGADYASSAVPTQARWIPFGFFGQLVTAAAAANREVAIEFQRSGNVIGGGVASEIQTATLTEDYVGLGGGITSAGVSVALAGGVIGIGLGRFPLLAGDTINPKTYNIQGLDQWSTGRHMVEEWIDP